MTGLDRWAAGRLRVYIVDPHQPLRTRLCALLRKARIDCTAFADAEAALRVNRAAPDIIVIGPGGDRAWLRAARARWPHLRTIGLSAAIRSGECSTFSPLRGLLGVDYLLSAPPDGAELLAALVLAAADIDDRGAMAIAS